MSGQDTIPKQIPLCVRYVASVLRDAHAMVSVAEALLARRSFHPLRGTKDAVYVSSLFSEPECWLARIIWRSYGKLSEPKALDPLDEVRVVEIHLAPSFADEPMLVLAKAVLREPKTRREIWDAWDSDGYVGDVLGRGAATDSTLDLPTGAAAKVLGIASSIRVLTSPMRNVPDEDAVLHRLVDPLLNL